MAEENKVKETKARVSKYAQAKRRTLTVPMLKLNAHDTVAVQFTGESRKQQIGAANADGKKKEPATLLRCTDLDTGQNVDLIAPTVVLAGLVRAFGASEPDFKSWSAIKDKKVLLKAGEKRPGKAYLDVHLDEIVE